MHQGSCIPLLLSPALCSFSILSSVSHWCTQPSYMLSSVASPVSFPLAAGEEGGILSTGAVNPPQGLLLGSRRSHSHHYSLLPSLLLMHLIYCLRRDNRSLL